MKILLSKLVDSKDALTRLMAEKYPIKITYRIKKNFELMDKEYTEYESARATLIMEKYGIQDPETGNWKVTSENMPAFAEELNDFLSEEVDLPFNTIILPHDSTISTADMILLEWMLYLEEYNTGEPNVQA